MGETSAYRLAYMFALCSLLSADRFGSADMVKAIMALMKKLRDWADTALNDDERGELAAIAGRPRGALPVLNGMPFSSGHIDGARRAVATLPESRRDGISQGAAIQAYAETTGLRPSNMMAAALHARIVALDRWQEANPQHRSDLVDVFEAAARCPLVETQEGFGFDAARFTDLVEFCGELPW